MGLGALTGEEIPGDRSSERAAASKVVLGPNTACNGYQKKCCCTPTVNRCQLLASHTLGQVGKSASMDRDKHTLLLNSTLSPWPPLHPRDL